MDDGRAVLYPVRPGWRWTGKELEWCRKWEIEDAELTPTERTSRALEGSMKGIMGFLEFTMETGDQFEDGWLPTLDTSLSVDEHNQVLYRFYQKPMASRQALHKNTAMAENAKMQSLANDLTRRMLTTSESLPTSVRLGVVDDYAQILVNSGHGIQSARKSCSSGLLFYEKRLYESKRPGGKPLHQSEKQSRGKRVWKKMTGKTDWYKDETNKRKLEDVQEEEGDWQHSPKKRKTENRDKLAERSTATNGVHPTTSVIIVEQTVKGELASGMRDIMGKLEGMLGYRFKVAENTGTTLKSLLSNRDPWAGGLCERLECFPCSQDSEEKPECSQSNIVYESLCTMCNKEEKHEGGNKKHETLMDGRENPSIYVGETSRSLHERAGEHGKAARDGDEDSHMVKHWSNHHVGEGNPSFRFNIVKRYKTALTRQVGEAVRIELRGNVLNSKGEYNRCRLPRLVVDESWKEGRKKMTEEEEAIARRWEKAGESGEERIGTHNSKRQGIADTGRKIEKVEIQYY